MMILLKRSEPLYHRLFLGFRRTSNATNRHENNSSLNFIYNRDTGVISKVSPDDSRVVKPLFKTVIGLEIHAQLSVPTKLFSDAPTKHHPLFNHLTDIPNTAVAAHDIAYPGTLPLLSKTSVQYAVMSAAALQCSIQSNSRFERKHYFYPDLPLGYQVTMQRWPIAKDGTLNCRRYTPPETTLHQPKQKKKTRNRGRNKINTSDTNDSQEAPFPADVLSKFFTVGIDRIQIEQDTGKTTTISTSQKAVSLIDFNRAGCSLIEIVFKPQINAAHEAASVASTVQSLLRHIETCDGKLEDGSLRVDLNISIAPLDDGEDTKSSDHGVDLDNPFHKYLPPGIGNRVEVKNLNSLRQIIQSVEYEALRQTRDRLDGKSIFQETRTFDPKSGVTIKLRSKGGAVDYRFIPEPDLPPLILNDDILDGKTLDEFLSDRLPELPEEATTRLMNTYGISEPAALIITSDRPAISMYEEAVKVSLANIKVEGDELKKAPITVANWLCNDLFALVKESATKRDEHHATLDTGINDGALVHPISMRYSKVDENRLGLLISLIIDGQVSTTQGKKLLEIMYKDDFTSTPQDIADSRGWKLITDPEELKELCRTVILDVANQAQLVQYSQGGKHVKKMSKFFIGKTMAASKGNAHPELLRSALEMVLHEIAPGVE